MTAVFSLQFSSSRQYPKRSVQNKSTRMDSEAGTEFGESNQYQLYHAWLLCPSGHAKHMTMTSRDEEWLCLTARSIRSVIQTLLS